MTNTRYPVFIFILLITICAVTIFRKADNAVFENEELEEMVANAEFDILRTADPVTGKIPSGKLMAAFNTLKQRGFYQQQNNLFKTDELTGWQQIDDFFPSLAVTKITYDPSNTQLFYFCTGEGWFNADAAKGAGVFKSEDGGATWFQLTSTANPTFDYCQDMVVHPTTGAIYVGTRTGGLQRSTDGGATWEKVLGFGVGASKNSICEIELTADGGLFVGIGIFDTDGIYYSPSGDAGTFVKQTSGLPASGYFRIKMATAKSDANTAYSVFCNNTDYKIKGVYKTTNKGATWTEINRPENNYDFAAKQAWYDLSLAVDPNNADVVAMGGLHVWRSRDGGNSWERMTTGGLDSVLIRYMHVDQHEITFKNSDEVYFGNDGGIFATKNFTDEHPFIYDKNYGYNVTQFYSVAIHPENGNPQLMGGTQDNGTPFTFDSGIAPYKMVSGGDGAFTAFNYANAEKFYTASQLRRLFRFDNGGLEFPDTISNPALTDNNTLFINPFDIDASDPEVIYQCSNIGIWRLKNASTADTSAWEKASNLNGVLSAIGSSPAAPGVLFIGRSSGTGDIYRLNDAYTSDFTTTPFNADPFDSLPDAAFLSTIYCSSIVVDVNDANHVIVTYSNFNIKSIWESFDALAFEPHWHCIEGDLPDLPVYWSAIHPDYPDVVYIATELGVFYTDHVDGYATHWIPCSSFPIVRTDMLRIRVADKKIVAATHGRGLWESFLSGPEGINNILWRDRGPNNIGGRTRTIMIDPNDPTGKTVWAGSVGGGLWKTTDIDAVSVNEPVNEMDLNLSLFPNPAHTNVQINFTQNGMYQPQIYVIDLYGKQIASIAAAKTIGTQIINWEIPNLLANGNYFIVAIAGNNKIVKPLIIL